MASLNDTVLDCIFNEHGLYIMPSFTVVRCFLFFPLYFLILQTGFQRRRQNRRLTVSHADFFTYNSLVFELLFLTGCVMYSVASFQFNYNVLNFTLVMFAFVYPGMQSLHVLTCGERYLAVVHPVIYLDLKKQKWIRARWVFVFLIWVFCFLWSILLLGMREPNIASIVLFGTFAAIISFCSVQVLRALRNPSPGEGRGASQTKRKAFWTIIIILFVILLSLTYLVFIVVAEKHYLLKQELVCNLQKSSAWLDLPSSLVLPLLFLHRAGKLPTCRGKTDKSPSVELRG